MFIALTFLLHIEYGKKKAAGTTPAALFINAPYFL